MLDLPLASWFYFFPVLAALVLFFLRIRQLQIIFAFVLLHRLHRFEVKCGFGGVPLTLGILVQCVLLHLFNLDGVGVDSGSDVVFDCVDGGAGLLCLAPLGSSQRWIEHRFVIDSFGVVRIHLLLTFKA
jgi:hypothetical protein